MSIQPLEEMLPKAGNSIYRLVRMAATRALELSEGRKCLIENPSSDKATTMALEEILAGRVVSREAKDLLAKPEKEKPQKKQAELEAVLESE
ncbi:MAG TPA: DNA-directed RNA polymerase subunit omega [Candidatus Omnitrophota bacterium]|nr:DNA-directed RNA polymerase subunit omega [Candidatus Omnitrophota bacterium]